jgi:hypothetical protein
MHGQYIRNIDSLLVKKTHSSGFRRKGKAETESEIVASQDKSLQTILRNKDIEH